MMYIWEVMWRVYLSVTKATVVLQLLRLCSWFSKLIFTVIGYNLQRAAHWWAYPMRHSASKKAENKPAFICIMDGTNREYTWIQFIHIWAFHNKCHLTVLYKTNRSNLHTEPLTVQQFLLLNIHVVTKLSNPNLFAVCSSSNRINGRNYSHSEITCKLANLHLEIGRKSLQEQRGKKNMLALFFCFSGRNFDQNCCTFCTSLHVFPTGRSL